VDRTGQVLEASPAQPDRSKGALINPVRSRIRSTVPGDHVESVRVAAAFIRSGAPVIGDLVARGEIDVALPAVVPPAQIPLSPQPIDDEIQKFPGASLVLARSREEIRTRLDDPATNPASLGTGSL
jgi:hypothetical protein